MNDFKYFDDILTAVESLSSDQYEDDLVELAYQSAVRSKEWEISIDRIEDELLSSAEYVGIDCSTAQFDICQGISDGLNALGAYCRLRDSYPMKQEK